jgi:hypothetical protein
MIVKARFCNKNPLISFIIEITPPYSADTAHNHAQHKHHSDLYARTAPAGKPVRNEV